MPKLAWFKFRPAAWRGDAELRKCSLAARGLWIEMLGLMHEAEPYGHLKIEVSDLARIASIPAQTCRKLLKELQESSIFSETNEGVFYSRRMVRDHAKELKDKENGSKGGHASHAKGVDPQVDPENQESESLRKNPPPTPLTGGTPQSMFEADRKREQRKAIARAPRPASPMTTIPSDFSLTPDLVAVAVRIGVDAEATFRKFKRHYSEIAPTKKSGNWNASFTAWCEEEKARAKPRIVAAGVRPDDEGRPFSHYGDDGLPRYHEH